MIPLEGPSNDHLHSTSQAVLQNQGQKNDIGILCGL